MIEPISKITLARNVLNRLIEAIKNGEWQPGSRIPNEHDLANDFRVSRNSIREAVKTLNNMGILESKPGSGTFLKEEAVRRIMNLELFQEGYEKATLTELTEIRVLIECQAAYWAAERATEEDFEVLLNILTKSRESVNKNLHNQDYIHFLFHETVAQISNNSFILRFLSSIRGEIEAQRSKESLKKSSGNGP